MALKLRDNSRNKPVAKPLPPPLQAKFLQAVQCHQNGDLTQARSAYDEILASHPKHADSLHLAGVLAYQQQRFDVAIKLIAKAIKVNPDEAAFYSNIGLAWLDLKRFDEALLSFDKALALHPRFEEALNNRGVALFELKRLADALLSYDAALALKPGYAEAHNNRGNALLGLDRPEEALASFDKALALRPGYAEAHSNRGNALLALERPHDALISYDKALSISPDHVEANYNRGNALLGLKRLDEARVAFITALAVDPGRVSILRQLAGVSDQLDRCDEARRHLDAALQIDANDAETLRAMAVHCIHQERWAEAESWLRRALAVKPDAAASLRTLGGVLDELKRHDEAWTYLEPALRIDARDVDTLHAIGNHYARQERWAEAEGWVRRALTLEPAHVGCLNDLTVILLAEGDLGAAFATALQSLRVETTDEAKKAFVYAASRLRPTTFDPSLIAILCEALREPWDRPHEMMGLACHLLKQDPEFRRLLQSAKLTDNGISYDEQRWETVAGEGLQSGSLLAVTLASAPISDGELEDCFTWARRLLLDEATGPRPSSDESGLRNGFYGALAQQCFINEYVFFQDADEVRKAAELSDRLTQSIEVGENIPAVRVLAVACYVPLHTIAGAEKLLQREWPEQVRSVLVQQIQEPLDERRLRCSIPSLTAIENTVSAAVQLQYEENPYPRWVKLPKAAKAEDINASIRKRFPLAAFRPIANADHPEVLIAGCGTGQHSITTAISIKGARLLAVDLSRASLGYAKRKTGELGIESIDYAQADLLQLNSLGREFDVVESSGVLHHLEKPFDGWDVLLSLLRPNGLMRLGFYSEHARRDIVRVRDLIGERGIAPTPQGIREFRRTLRRSDAANQFGFATGSSDFFSMSACRDLLFHTQEQRMTLDVIKAFLERHELTFLGFDIDAAVLRSYKSRFPGDAAATNLDQWRVYEEENSSTFVGMYQFWVQKA
jgi:tetratricopeptide (TPR) repeat protein/2-polyprenyl-3-methyl-5-hydroxy-6-metoxy-1,4-benzoquinol methylase